MAGAPAPPCPSPSLLPPPHPLPPAHLPWHQYLCLALVLTPVSIHSPPTPSLNRAGLRSQLSDLGLSGWHLGISPLGDRILASQVGIFAPTSANVRVVDCALSSAQWAIAGRVDGATPGAGTIPGANTTVALGRLHCFSLGGVGANGVRIRREFVVRACSGMRMRSRTPVWGCNPVHGHVRLHVHMHPPTHVRR